MLLTTRYTDVNRTLTAAKTVPDRVTLVSEQVFVSIPNETRTYT